MAKESGSAPQRRLGRAILSFFLLVVVAFGGVLAYLHTEDGFTRVLVPVLNRFLPSPVEAARGRVSLNGRLEFDQARFQSDVLGIDLGADRVVLDIDPISLFDGRFHVYGGEIDGLHYRSTPAQKGGASGDADSPEQSDGSTWEIPVEIDELRARSAVWSSGEGDRDRAVVGPLDIEIADLRPGATARLRVDGAVQLGMETKEERAGHIEATVQLTQDESGLVTRGKVDASAQFDSTGDPDGRPIGFDTVLDLAIDDAETRDLKLSMHALRDEKPVGDVEATVRWKVEGARGKEERRLLSAVADVRELQMAALNPLFDALGMSRMTAGHVDAEVDVSSGPDRSLDVDMRVDMEGVAAQMADGDEPVSSLTLRFRHKGNWHGERQQVRVEAMSLRIGPDRAPKIEAVLGQPVVLRRATGGGGAIDPGEAAAFDATINDLTVAELKQWLHPLRIDAFDSLKAGLLQGRVELDVAGLGDDIGISPKLRLSDFHFDLGAGEVGPLVLSIDTASRLTKRRNLTIERMRVDFAGTTGDLLTTRTTGSLDLTVPSGRLRVEASAADLGRLVSTVGTVPRGESRSLRGGVTAGTFEIGLGAAPSAYDLSGQMTIDDLSLFLDGGHTVRQDLRLVTKLTTGATKGVLVVQELSAELGGGDETRRAKIHAEGTVDTAGTGVGGKLDVTVEELRLGPWIAALGEGRFESLGDLPVDATIAIVAEPQSGALSFRGEEHFTFRGREGVEKKLTIRNEWRRTSQGRAEFSAAVSSSGGASPDDRATLQGEWLAAGPGTAEKLSLEVDVERLDATPYVVPFLPEALAAEGGPDDGTGESAPGSSERAAAPETDQASGPDVPPMDIDLKASIRDFRFREAEFSSGQLTARRSGGDLRVELAPSRILGGTIQGKLARRRGAEQRLAWDLVVDAADIGKLARSIGTEERIEGILVLDTSAKGSGFTTEALRQNLVGHVTGEMTSARFAGTPLFSYMARVTGIRQFEDIVFNDFQADVAIGEGVARIREMEGAGMVANVVFTGEATLAGEVHVDVNPRLGPSFSGNLGKIFGLGALVKTASGFIALPIDVTVRGPYTNLQLGMRARAPGVLDELTGGVAGAAGVAVGSEVTKGAGTVLKWGRSLFGGGD